VQIDFAMSAAAGQSGRRRVRAVGDPCRAWRRGWRRLNREFNGILNPADLEDVLSVAALYRL
jgi:hypothetical protein